MPYTDGPPIKLQSGGVLRVPLYQTAYDTPPEIGTAAQQNMDANSAEPYITRYDPAAKIQYAMLPQPFDYGLNAYPSDVPIYTRYHGTFTYDVAGHNAAAGSRNPPSDWGGFNWRLGTLYNVGWKSGLPTWHQSPVQTRTTFIQGGTPDPNKPDTDNFPQKQQGPCLTCWPSWLCYEPYTFSSFYGQLFDMGGPMPARFRTLATQQSDGSFIDAGEYPMLHKGVAPKLIGFSAVVGNSEHGAISELGSFFDVVGAAKKKTEDPFFLFAATWEQGWGGWANGAQVAINRKGWMIGAGSNNGLNGPCFFPYEATPSAPRGMILQNASGNQIVLGHDLPAVRMDGEEPDHVISNPWPSELVIIDDDELQAAFKQVSLIQNGWLHIIPVALQRFQGQAQSFLILDPSNGLYYPLQFVPKSEAAAQAISVPGFIAKYSAGGYIMGQNTQNVATANKLFHTSGFALDYNARPLTAHPVGLPCFNPCVPSLILGD